MIPVPTFTRPILHREDDQPGVPEVDLSPLASAQARRAARLDAGTVKHLQRGDVGCCGARQAS